MLWFMGCSGALWCTESSAGGAAQTVIRSVRCMFTLNVYELAVLLKETSGHRPAVFVETEPETGCLPEQGDVTT